MYEILTKKLIAPSTYQMEIYAPRVAKKIQAGQFIILRVCDEGERIPLTSADVDKSRDAVMIIFNVVGLSTKLLAALVVGDRLQDFVGPLGRATKIDGLKRVLCIGGGVGTAVVYPIVKQLYENDTYVDVIVGARNRDYIILEDELIKCSDRLFITTDDGTYGKKGFVTDALKDLLENDEQYDEIITIGPMIMMKFVCKLTEKYGVKTIVSLNPLMVDGTGMCGCCRVRVGGETKYACVDGPDFDGHKVDFDEAMTRSNIFKQEEKAKDEKHPCGGIYHG